jgi:glycosyltransferase involved in cell wall biosynthesis
MESRSRAPRVLIDAGNLRHGGGVQVAASFLQEVATMSRSGTHGPYPWLPGLIVEASEEVIANLSEETRRILRPRLVKGRWYRVKARWRQKELDVEFTIFGPAYGGRRAANHLVGFADGTSVYPRPPELPKARWWEYLVGRLRTLLSRRSFLKSDRIVVETPALKSKLVEVIGFPRDDIDVVPNTYHQVFVEPTIDASFVSNVRERTQDAFVFAFISRGYPHKNLDFLGLVGAHLWDDHSMKCRFLVTLTAEEWAVRTPAFRRYALNVGVLRINEVPSAYAASDFAIFPSLLEAFSATPLEALVSKTLLFASDRDFVRTVVGDAAVYFDPSNARETASVIAQVIGDPGRREVQARRAAGILPLLPSASERARQYLCIIDGLVNTSVAGQ